MAHKKKENRDRKRKQPIPQSCAIPTKKQREAKDRKNWRKSYAVD